MATFKKYKMFTLVTVYDTVYMTNKNGAFAKFGVAKGRKFSNL